MSRTLREFKGKKYPEKSRKKPKKTKFFGYPEDKWARGYGKNGYARSYGQNSGTSANYPKHILRTKKKGYE